jgi:uncharacterized protein
MTHLIKTEAQLIALFDQVGEASIRKETSFLHPIYQQWINASPFAVLATAGLNGTNGLDVSPRGDPAPLVRIVDDRTILLPERRGNNRIDGLKNILSNPQVALIFFIAGVRETVRVNGRAVITVDPDILNSFAIGSALPKCVIEISVEQVFFQCGRALIRSELWSPANEQQLSAVPTAGAMLNVLTASEIDGATYDKELPARQRATLY